MIPPELIKKIRHIEIRTKHLATDTLAGRYHSTFKGQGMHFDEVREYQPGDDTRNIDWNVTARMNHPYTKQYIEERELTLILLIDISASNLFGSRTQTKRELAAEIAALLAFTAAKNNDKIGLLLYTDTIEKYIPPRKGRRHNLRIIRDILHHQPKQRRTNLNQALQYLTRVTHQRAIIILISDLLGQTNPTKTDIHTHLRRSAITSNTLRQTPHTTLRQTKRRHDIIAIQITDPYETTLPNIGTITLKDAETGQTIEINTANPKKRATFKHRQQKTQTELKQLLNTANIDHIQIQPNQPYIQPLTHLLQNRHKKHQPH